MTILSPAKLLVVLVVAIIVLGPDKLPKVARQVGSLWGDFRRLRERLETDVRGNFPDLPSTDKITQAVRSPISFLDSLADTHAADNESNSGSRPTEVRTRAGETTAPAPRRPPGTGWWHRRRPTGRSARSAPRRRRRSPACRSATRRAPSTVSRATGRAVPDDPSLN